MNTLKPGAHVRPQSGQEPAELDGGGRHRPGQGRAPHDQPTGGDEVSGA